MYWRLILSILCKTLSCMSSQQVALHHTQVAAMPVPSALLGSMCRELCQRVTEILSSQLTVWTEPQKQKSFLWPREYHSHEFLPSSSGSSATGRPTGSMWAFFTRTAAKQNKSHYGAFCNACTLAGHSVKVLGGSDAMKSHLVKCDHVSDDVKAWA